MSMTITKVETIWFKAVPQAEWQASSGASRQAFPNNLWVRIYTDDGLVGLGETYYLPRAIAAVVHDVLAPLLIGRPARDIEHHWANMAALVSFCDATGPGMPAASAIDIATSDLLCQHAGERTEQQPGSPRRQPL